MSLKNLFSPQVARTAVLGIGLAFGTAACTTDQYGNTAVTPEGAAAAALAAGAAGALLGGALSNNNGNHHHHHGGQPIILHPRHPGGFHRGPVIHSCGVDYWGRPIPCGWR